MPYHVNDRHFYSSMLMKWKRYDKGQQPALTNCRRLELSSRLLPSTLIDLG